MTFDPQNADVLYATYGNFGGTHVFRSDDGGGSWRALDGVGERALPDIPVHSLVVDPDDSSRLYLGTDLGVFVSPDGGARWMVEETGFGPVVTEWLSLVRDTSGPAAAVRVHTRTRRVARQAAAGRAANPARPASESLRLRAGLGRC